MNEENPKKAFITIDHLIIFVVLLLVLATSTSIYFYKQSKANPEMNTQGQSEVATILKALGQLIVLPKDEIPRMTTIDDLEKLKDQPFFTNAKKGDKFLIFDASKKAILFDPVANKIVEMAPINSEIQK